MTSVITTPPMKSVITTLPMKSAITILPMTFCPHSPVSNKSDFPNKAFQALPQQNNAYKSGVGQALSRVTGRAACPTIG
jgi:hypothetical protein